MVGYVTWREVPNPLGKARKVPTNPETKKNMSALNPDNWTTYEQAKATGYHVGMVLSDGDPYFLLDLDNCFHDGKWDDGVQTICDLFPGTAIEVSHNGHGLHIMAQTDAAFLGAREHKFDAHGIACEFYHNNRFVALGQGMKGDISLDMTTQLDAFVPLKTVDMTPVNASPSDGPVEEYTGPAADDTLIEMMKAQKSSAGVLFSGGASAKDLWEKNLVKLRVAYPSSSGEPFDHSSADAALMSHLAFWTGKDRERMERVFNRSKLVRKKWKKRPEYRQATLDFAILKCSGVYDKIRDISGDELMNTLDQVTYFRGCCYVINDHKVMIPGGVLLNPAQFKAKYGGYCFQMSKDMTKPSYNAFDAFTENRAHPFPQVTRTRFRPDLAAGLIFDDGVNVYSPADTKCEEGDVSLYLDLLKKMLPDFNDRMILISWFASLIQNPGKKLIWSPVLQGTKGNGKSFLAECLIQAIGEQYCWTVKPQKIDAQFNTFLQNRMFINVQEMHMFSKSFEMMDTLKDYISETRQEVEGKGANAVMINDYCANWFFTSNYKDAVKKEKDDRRFCVFFTAQQTREDMLNVGMLTGEYFPKLWDWARKGGFSNIHHYLRNYKIKVGMDPATDCFLAPTSTSTPEAIAVSMDIMDQYIMEAIEAQEIGFRGGWISTWHLSRLLAEYGMKRGPIRISTALQEKGYENRGRATIPIMQEGNKRPSLYALPGVTSDYSVAQGYIAAPLSLVVP